MKMNQTFPTISSYSDQTDNNPKHKSFFEVNVNNSALEARLRTFDNWPSTQLSKEALASAGFEYTGQDDIVLCRFCKIEGYNWVSGDDPMADHREWSPDCPFIRTVENGRSGSNRNADTCGLYGIEVLPNSLPEDRRSIDLQQLGIHKGSGPHNQDKITVNSRLATFENWPKSIKQRPVDLAEAGFYYTGVGDQTLCFYCGGGLKDWEESDEPWEQHALWFSKCVFLNLKKGKDFVEKVKQRADPLLSLPGTSQDKTKELEEPKEPCSRTPEKAEKTTETEATEKTLCKICYKNELGVVFLPCGHVVACVDCASALKTCAVCRKPLEATVRAFLS
nr:baculoviral IAP repeat-containing protein 2 [Leptinotarsa decemlineata]XP_023022307.1 baculoviral IAP repeat-containing protein 2 [Leptinotarsa decemlineata]XP_023022308.1 baculoviral IAP repeat-containing protein 2 [Leptinotarsa decemlineata]XP_023022310.1 baculoviral IAP repeat-containing protein 2 [Leptinotarsa decemlineata]